MARREVTVKTAGNVDDSELDKQEKGAKADRGAASERGEKKDKLKAFLKALDEHANEQCSVVIIRMAPRMCDGRKVKLGGILQIPISDFGDTDPMLVIENTRAQVEQEHGIGSYNCALRNGSGKILRMWSFEVLSGDIPEEDFAPDAGNAAVAAAATNARLPVEPDVQTELNMEKAEHARLMAKKEVNRLKKYNKELAAEVEPESVLGNEEREDPRSMMPDIDEMAKQIEAKVRAEYEAKAKEEATQSTLKDLTEAVKDLKNNPPAATGGGASSMFDGILKVMLANQESNTKLLVEALKPRVEQQQQQLPAVVEHLIQAAINKTIPADGAGQGPMDHAIETVSRIVGLRNEMGLPFGGASTPPEPTPWWQTLIENLSGPVQEFMAIKKMELERSKPGMSAEEIDAAVRAQVEAQVAKIKAQQARVQAKQEKQPFAKTTPKPADTTAPEAVEPGAPQELPPQQFKPLDQTLPINGPLPGVRTERELPPQAPVQRAVGGNGEVKAAMVLVLKRLQEELATTPSEMTWMREAYRLLPEAVMEELEADPSEAGLRKFLMTYANRLTLMNISATLTSDKDKEAWFNAGLSAWRAQVEAARQPQEEPQEAQGGIVPSGSAADEEGTDGATQ